METKSHLVNTNAVLQKALQALEAETKKDLVLRCDDLPSVQGSERALEEVFSQLLAMIMDKKAAVSKLFLHIHCSQDASLSVVQEDKDLKPFLIQFSTNVSPCSDWLKINEPAIGRVAATLKLFNGSLSVNQVKNSGCIFSISLPGKHP